jgi:hypothetical protein
LCPATILELVGHLQKSGPKSAVVIPALRLENLENFNEL